MIFVRIGLETWLYIGMNRRILVLMIMIKSGHR